MPTPTKVPATFPPCCQNPLLVDLLFGLIPDAEDPEDVLDEVGVESAVVELDVDDESELVDVELERLDEDAVLDCAEDDDDTTLEELTADDEEAADELGDEDETTELEVVEGTCEELVTGVLEETALLEV